MVRKGFERAHTLSAHALELVWHKKNVQKQLCAWIVASATGHADLLVAPLAGRW